MRAILVAAAWFVSSPALADEEMRHLGPVTGIATSGHNIYSCSQVGLLWSSGDSKILSAVVTPEFKVSDVVAVGNQRLAICGGSPKEFGMVGVVEVPSGKMTTQKFGDDIIYAVAVSPSQKSLVAACADGQIVLFNLPLDASKQPLIVHKHTSTARTVAFSPDGKLVVSGGLDGVILMTQIDDDGSIHGKPRALQEHTAGVECLAFSPDGKHFASGARDSKLRLHSVDGRLLRTYAGIGMENEPAVERLPARLWALVWHEDQLVAGTSKGTVYRMSLTDDTWSPLERKVDGAIYALAFGTDGSLWIGSKSLLAR